MSDEWPDEPEGDPLRDDPWDETLRPLQADATISAMLRAGALAAREVAAAWSYDWDDVFHSDLPLSRRYYDLRLIEYRRDWAFSVAEQLAAAADDLATVRRLETIRQDLTALAARLIADPRNVPTSVAVQAIEAVPAAQPRAERRTPPASFCRTVEPRRVRW